MNEADKSVIRQFLATSAAAKWFDEARMAVPSMKLSDAKDERLYNISLQQKEGYLMAMSTLLSIAIESTYIDPGVKPIDTTVD